MANSLFSLVKTFTLAVFATAAWPAFADFIDPDFDSQNPAEVLGLKTPFTKDDAKAAYRRLAKIYHEDKARGETLEELERDRQQRHKIMAKLGEAKNMLTKDFYSPSGPSADFWANARTEQEEVDDRRARLPGFDPGDIEEVIENGRTITRFHSPVRYDSADDVYTDTMSGISFSYNAELSIYSNGRYWYSPEHDVILDPLRKKLVLPLEPKWRKLSLLDERVWINDEYGKPMKERYAVSRDINERRELAKKFKRPQLTLLAGKGGKTSKSSSRKKESLGGLAKLPFDVSIAAKMDYNQALGLFYDPSRKRHYQFISVDDGPGYLLEVPAQLAKDAKEKLSAPKRMSGMEAKYCDFLIDDTKRR